MAEPGGRRGAMSRRRPSATRWPPKMTTEEQAEARRLVRSWRSGEKDDAPKTAAVPRAAPPSLSADQPPPRRDPGSASADDSAGLQARAG